MRLRAFESALIAAKQRPGSEDYDEVQSATDRQLLEQPVENDR